MLRSGTRLWPNVRIVSGQCLTVGVMVELDVRRLALPENRVINQTVVCWQKHALAGHHPRRWVVRGVSTKMPPAARTLRVGCRARPRRPLHRTLCRWVTHPGLLQWLGVSPHATSATYRYSWLVADTRGQSPCCLGNLPSRLGVTPLADALLMHQFSLRATWHSPSLRS